MKTMLILEYLENAWSVHVCLVGSGCWLFAFLASTELFFLTSHVSVRNWVFKSYLDYCGNNCNT